MQFTMSYAPNLSLNSPSSVLEYIVFPTLKAKSTLLFSQTYWNPKLLGPLLALLATCLIYATVFYTHTRVSVRLYSKYQRLPATKAIKGAVLAVHVVSGLAEVFRWHVRGLSGGMPEADGLDVVLCLAQSATNLVLVKHLARGLPIMTRPSYQAGAVLRPIMTIAAWYYGRAVWHKASVHIVNGFIYTRVLIYLVGPLMKRNHEATSSAQGMYNLAVFSAALLAVAESGIPHLPKLYVLFVVAIGALNRWTSSNLKTADTAPPTKRHVLILLAQLGFTELTNVEPVQLIKEVADALPDVYAVGEVDVTSATAEVTIPIPAIG